MAVVPNAGSLVFSPDSKRIAYGTATSLVVADEDGSARTALPVKAFPELWRDDGTILISTVVDNEERWGSVRPDGSDLTWYPADVQGFPSPDGTRFLVVNENGSTGELHVVTSDGTAEQSILFRPAPGPFAVWSPDGSRFLYAGREGSRTVVHVVSADESVNRIVASSSLPWMSTPIWSPSGRAFAYAPYGPRRAALAVVQVAGGIRTFPIDGLGLEAWSPDGHRLLLTRGPYQIKSLDGDPARSSSPLFSLDLATGRIRTLGFGGWEATYSPDRRSIAMASGGECRDLVGIYVMRADGTSRRRLTRDCRYYGTPGDDVLNPVWTCCDSNPPYIVFGLAGDDTLHAGGGNPYDGSTLVGGPGNDTLVGSIRGDLLEGGPGDDTIDGDLGADVIVGGPGHDHIDAGRGADVIRAVDGERDWIDCGRPGDGKNRPDVVYADSVDVVASDCKVVHRITR